MSSVIYGTLSGVWTEVLAFATLGNSWNVEYGPYDIAYDRGAIATLELLKSCK